MLKEKNVSVNCVSGSIIGTGVMCVSLDLFKVLLPVFIVIPLLDQSLVLYG